MNEMIERYIYDVIRRLPEIERSEVRRALDESISDMLPDNPNEEDIINVIIKLGEPAKLAEQYRQSPHYLISPALFELYISVLKKVVVIVAAVCACAGLLTVVFSKSGSIAALIATSLSTAMSGSLQAAFWVTLGFFLTERYGGKKQKLWTINDLPSLPDLTDKKSVKISRSSSVAGMILSVFFTVLLITIIIRDEWFFVFVRDSVIINPFSKAASDRFIPYLILFGVMEFIVNGLKLYWGKWNIPIVIGVIIQNIAVVSIVVYILQWSDLISDEFSAFTKTLIGDADILRYMISDVTGAFFFIIFIVAAAIDIGAAVWNTVKSTRQSV